MARMGRVVGTGIGRAGRVHRMGGICDEGYGGPGWNEERRERTDGHPGPTRFEWIK